MSEAINKGGQASNGLPVIIAEWQKNSRETLRVQISEYKGQQLIDCRSWYADTNGNLKAGRGGLTISVRHLPQLAKALSDALNAATAQGLLAGGDA